MVYLIYKIVNAISESIFSIVITIIILLDSQAHY